MTYPLGKGSDFKGVYNIYKNTFAFYQSNKVKVEENIMLFRGLDDPELDKVFFGLAEKLRYNVELIDGIYEQFNQENYIKGEVAPVFFGSALNNFGVKELLDTFVEIAPPPLERETTAGVVKPHDDTMSGFIFKIHANLDPKHRDRIAFLRICSGRFERNKFYYHVRLEREMKFANPASFMAQAKTLVDAAYPGDVIGLYDSGTFKIGDTLTEGGKFMFKGVPRFSPEIFRLVRNLDPFKSKQLEKGIQYLTDEGLAQLFTQNLGNKKIIGVVGELQFDVLKYRLLHEFGASVDFSPINAYKAFWVKFKSKDDIEDLLRLRSHFLYLDKNNNLVFLADSLYSLHMAQEKNPKAKFDSSIEHNDQTLLLDENI